MPLSIEVLNPKHKEWCKITSLGPQDGYLVLPQILPDGSRKVYLVDCDKSDNFSSFYSFSLPENVGDAQIRELIERGELTQNSEVTIRKGDRMIYAIKSVEEDSRYLTSFHQE